jgi:predicted transcriptional regulator
MVQLTEDLLARLDEEAGARGCSRSALIRQAVEEHLDRSSEAAKIRRYVAGYTAQPPGAVDEWGDLAASADRDGRELAGRLDRDEQPGTGSSW